MNSNELINCLKFPRNISVDKIADLEIILDEFPYFHSAQFLYLIALKNQNSYKYNNRLKKAAAYTTDRSVLFDFISANDYNFNLDQDNQFSEYFEVTNLDTNKSKLEDSVQKEDENTSKNTLQIGKPLLFSASESHSFNEWLQVSFMKPIDREELKTNEKSNKKEASNTHSISTQSNFDLINKFITANPKIKPINTFDPGTIEFDDTIDDKNLMTETLAHVYLEQKKYQNAITAFTVLSLKYPEKSGFFALQIQAIKELQEK